MINLFKKYLLKLFVCMLVVCATNSNLHPQSFERQPNESVLEFAKRFAPEGHNLAISPDGFPYLFKLLKWNSDSNVLVAFYEKSGDRNDDGRDDYLLGFIFPPSEKSVYNRIFIDTIGPEGGEAEVDKVFSCSADSTKDQELAVLCTYPVVHTEAFGVLYCTYFYKPTATIKLTLLKNISDKFIECECSRFSDDSPKPAKYKTVAAVWKRLSRMGYKQFHNQTGKQFRNDKGNSGKN